MNILRDLGYGMRQIVRRPFFSVAIILTLAIGIGPNVAIFSVLKAVLLEPLPYPEPERLVQVWQTDIDGRYRQPFSWPGSGERFLTARCLRSIFTLPR